MTELQPVWCIIVNYNGWRDTLECLESVARVDYSLLRVIVVDNASTNESVKQIEAWAAGRVEAPAARVPELGHLTRPAAPKPLSMVVLTEDQAATARDAAAAPWLTVLRSAENVGFAGGNNVALRYLLARGNEGFAWLLNNDTVVAADALRELVAAAAPEVGAVGGTLLEYRVPSTIQAAAGGESRLWGSMARSLSSGRARGTGVEGRLDYICGACVLVPMHVVRTVGILDERFFMYAEDADWSLRMQRHGLRLAYAPSAQVWHKGGESAGSRTPFSDFHNVRSPLLLVHKHRPIALPLVAAYMAYRCIVPKLLRGERARLLGAWRGYIHALSGIVRGRAADRCTSGM